MDKDTDNDVAQNQEDESSNSINAGGRVMDIQAPKAALESSNDDSSTNSSNNPGDSETSNTESELQTELQPQSEGVDEVQTPPEAVTASGEFGPKSEPDTSEQTSDTSPLTPAESALDFTSPPEVSDSAVNTEEPPVEAPFSEPNIVNMADENSSQPPVESPLAISPQAVAKSNSPITVIVVAIIVAIVLAGVAVFVYLTNSGTTKTTTTSKTSNQSVIEKPKATMSDVDTTNQEIDKSLQSIDETKDFSSTELSDASLGL